QRFEQIEQLVAPPPAEKAQQPRFVFHLVPARARKQRLALCREVQRAATAITRHRLAHDEAAALELVHEGAEIGLLDAERPAHLVLRQAGIGSDHGEHAEAAGAEPQRREARNEVRVSTHLRAAQSVAELALERGHVYERGRAPGPRWLAIHARGRGALALSCPHRRSARAGETLDQILRDRARFHAAGPLRVASDPHALFETLDRERAVLQQPMMNLETGPAPLGEGGFNGDVLAEARRNHEARLHIDYGEPEDVVLLE